MNTLSIALRNVVKSMRSFIIYFISLSIGISMFYAFNALQDQPLFLHFTRQFAHSFDSLFDSLNRLNYFIAFVFAILIIYANAYLFKQRRQEFGLYMLLGMGKKKVLNILLIETFLIGILSLVFGLILGLGCSQLINILIGKFYVESAKWMVAQFSVSAMVKTLQTFVFLYVLAFILGMFSLRKAKLIDLFQAKSKNEKNWWQNPWIGGMLNFVGIGCLYFGFWRAIQIGRSLDDFNRLDDFSIACLAIIVGTYSLYLGIASIIPILLPQFKNYYYRGIHSFGMRQFTQQISSSIFSIATICLLQFMGLVILLGSYNIKTSIEYNSTRYLAYDQQIQILPYETIGQKIPQFDNEKVQQISEELDNYFVPFTKQEKHFELYALDDISDYSQKAQHFGLPLQYISRPVFIKNSQYNQIAGDFDLPKIKLSPQEYTFLSMDKNYALYSETEAILAKKLPDIHLFARTFHANPPRVIDGMLLQAEGLFSFYSYIVLNDKVFDEIAFRPYMQVCNFTYNQKGENQAKLLDKNYKMLVKKYKKAFNLINVSKNQVISRADAEAIGIMVIGLNLSIFLFIAAISVLALKSLLDFESYQQNFRLLRRLGASEAMIRRSLFHQLALYFYLPLIGAILETGIALLFLNDFLKSMYFTLQLNSVISISAFVIGLHFIYLLLAYSVNQVALRD